MADNTFAVSMNCYTWGRFDLAQCIEQVKKTPIRMLEVPAEQSRPGSLIPELMIDAPLDGQWRYSLADLRALLARDGFQVDSVDVFGFIGHPGTDQLVKRRIDFAQALGAEIVVLGCHHLGLAKAEQQPGGSQSREAKETRAAIYALLRDVGDYAADRGVKIAIEIHGGITANATAALRTMAEVDRENVGINFDTANILYYNVEFSPADGARELDALAKHVLHVHLKDIVRGKTRKEHVLPRLGQGEVDLPKVFQILHAAGFHGPFSFEVETFHGATVSDDISLYHDDLVASIEHLRSLGEFAA